MLVFTILLLVRGLLFHKGGRAQASICEAVTTEPIVDVGYATYLGNWSYPNTVAYLGIPYAEPPVGDLRFRTTVPLNTTRVREAVGGQVVNATDYPESCVQGSTGGEAGGAGSEDCLKINIYAPYGAKKGDNLPILFYIHGGAHVFGNPRNWPFNDWVHQSPNVVIVSVYYRLDSFGWLATPEFKDPTYGDFNVGFRDQLEALRWVKQYITAFGGDPDRVTINGQSSSAACVELHMVANYARAEQLFHGAIAQSVYRIPLPTPEQQQPLFQFYTEYAGCNASSIGDRMGCLRNTSVSALARAQDAAAQGKFGLYNVFHPVLDGILFTEYPTIQFQRGQFTRVPLIVGATSNDTLSKGTNISLALKQYFPALTEADIQAFLALHPLSNYDSPVQQFRAATGEPEVTCSREAMGGPASLYADTWTYRYNTPNPTIGSDEVTHAAENWMMFDGINTGFNGTGTFTPQTPAERAFASELVAYWLSFVRAGDPNTYKLDMSPVWEQYTPHSKVRMVLMQDPRNSTTNSGSYMEEEPTAEGVRCATIISKVLHTED